MTTYPIRKEGKLFAFEIENMLMPPRRICALLATKEGVTNIWKRTPFGAWEEVHVRFDFKGCRYQVWEPFGDNSRYWIGPENPNVDSPDIGEICDLFEGFNTLIPQAKAVVFLVGGLGVVAILAAYLKFALK